MKITVTETFGNLSQKTWQDGIQYSDSIFKDFYALIRQIKSEPNYGRDTHNVIELYTNGEHKNIIINGTEIFADIQDIHHTEVYNKSNNSHLLTINGRFKNGKLFETKIRFKDNELELLPGIVYAIILIGYSSDIDEFKTLWEFFYCGSLSENDPSNSINHIINAHQKATEILTKYSCAELFLQEGLSNAIETIKLQIDALSILHK